MESVFFPGRGTAGYSGEATTEAPGMSTSPPSPASRNPPRSGPTVDGSLTAGIASDMPRSVAQEGDEQGEDYRGWPLRRRLELLAFDARLAGVSQALLESLWEAIDSLGKRRTAGDR